MVDLFEQQRIRAEQDVAALEREEQGILSELEGRFGMRDILGVDVSSNFVLWWSSYRSSLASLCEFPYEKMRLCVQAAALRRRRRALLRETDPQQYREKFSAEPDRFFEEMEQRGCD